MAEPFDQFNETTDIYLEILREAQKIEDRKLIMMIHRRLRELQQSSRLTAHGCEIIPFPGSFSPTIPPLQDGPFWPKFAYSQIAAILFSYILLIVGNTFIS